jgi:hypothetical protein
MHGAIRWGPWAKGNGRYGHSIAIVILKLDKRNGLISLLESRNDVVRCHRWQRYKFIVNGTWTMFHDVINVDAIIGIGTRVKFL